MSHDYQSFWYKPKTRKPARENSLQELNRLIEQARRANVLHHPTLQTALSLLQRRPSSGRLLENAKNAFLQAQLQKAKEPIPEPTTLPSNFENTLGLSPNNKPVTLSMPHAMQHIGLFSKNGGGKTYWLYYYLLNSHQHWPTIIMLDFFEKDQNTNILKTLHNQGRSVLSLHWKQLQFNWFQLSHILSYEELRAELLDDLADAFDLKPYSKRTLREVLNNTDPLTPQNVYNTLKRRSYAYTDALEDNLYTFINTFPTPTQGWELSRVFNNKIIRIGLAGLDKAGQRFICTRTLSGLVAERKRQENPPSILLCLDEAHRILTKGSRIGSELASIVRSTNIALIATTQTLEGANSIEPTFLDNAGTLMLGPAGGLITLEKVGKAIGLDKEQIQWLRNNQRQGQFACSHPAANQPLLIRVPTLPTLETATPEFIEECYQQFLKEMPTIPKIQEQTEEEEQQPAELLSKRERLFLNTVSLNPWRTARELYNALSMGERTCIKTRDTLHSRELIAIHHDRLSSKGKPRQYVYPTAKGCKAINKQPLKGRGSYQHQLYCQLLRQQLTKEGCTVSVEHPLENGQYADVHVENGNTTVIIEVELSTKHVQENIKKLNLNEINGLLITAPRDLLEGLKEKAPNPLPPGLKFLELERTLKAKNLKTQLPTTNQSC